MFKIPEIFRKRLEKEIKGPLNLTDCVRLGIITEEEQFRLEKDRAIFRWELKVREMIDQGNSPLSPLTRRKRRTRGRGIIGG